MDGINTNSGFNLTNYTITFDVAKNATLESSVRIFDEGNNKGNIVKTGAGTMTITNSNNVYRGTTTISGGTLIAKSLGSIGTGSLTIGNATMEAAFEGNIPASNVTITGDSTLISSVSWNRFKNLSGSGTLTLIGSGFLAINNSFHARNFTGTFIVGTTTQAGKLSLEVQSNVLNADSGKIKVVNGIVDWRGFEQSFNSLEYLDGEMQNMTGKLTIGNEFKYNSSTALTVPCVIAGNAKLTKDNSGTLTLSGANTYTGGTTISDGTLKLTGSGTLGTGAVTNSGTLEFNNSTTTITPNISGAGDILVSAGTATLSGAVTQTGGTTTLADGTTLNIGNASTLYNLAVVDENASATLNITGNLTLNNSDLTKFIGSITAPVVTKTGLDTLQLCFDAENAVNLGSLVVSSGPVDLKGYMSGGITVDSGAVFSPGNSIGEAKYGGGYELKEGATLLLEVGKNEQGDILTDTLTYVPNLTDPKDTVFEGGSIIKIALDSSYDNAFEDGDVAEIQLPAGIKGSNGNDLDMNNLVFQSSMFDLVGYDSTTGILSVRYAEPAAGVPEPSTWALLLLGAAGLLYVRKRTRK
ncbi:MAG: autotransporter-associated beta strand repeat-containing protein [Thermoguttaceae bacterium]|nr:autotransporter-associated beta strand repeat-containing protein [Thermoguttaceae bacterium]